MLSLTPCKTACILFLLGIASTISAPAQTFTTITNFTGLDGSRPNSPLVQSVDGNLYGTDGGIFKVSPDGTLTVVHGTLAGTPVGGLTQATNLDLYGTTVAGGLFGCGSAYQVSTRGTVITANSFACGESGADPESGMIEGFDGNFYGTTTNGGGFQYGTFFMMLPGGALTTLNELHGPDGQFLNAGLVQGTDGDFYGVATNGGSNGYGTFFKIDTSGTLTVLHDFEGTDGANPQITLIQATNGNFYGVTMFGGANYTCFQGCGTVFEATPAGVVTVLHSFTGVDGLSPNGLLQATDGNFYGTTAGLGSSACTGSVCDGTIFQITPVGVFTTLHSFSGPDGKFPAAGMVQATNGTLYGTTKEGGTATTDNCQLNNVGCGTIFSLSMGLGPFVTVIPGARHVGQKVLILGSNLTGATSVSFNGISEGFVSLTPTYAIAVVPKSATSGTVQVVTPSGTLSSNVPFEVF